MNNFLKLLISLILLIAPISLNAQTFYLINPSETCKEYLGSAFNNFFKKRDNIYSMEVLESKEGVSKITKYKDLEFVYTIQGNGARLIITKEKTQNTGTLSFLDEDKPCNSLITLDKTYATNFINLDNKIETSFDQSNNKNHSNYNFSQLPLCKGEYNSSIWSNCFGEIKTKNGDKYIGEWRNGKYFGTGSYFFKNGDEYFGEWKDNKFEGIGTYKFKNGNKFIGQHKSGKFNGFGTFVYNSGARDVGEWKEGKLNGQAIQYNFDGTIKLQGIFKDDKLTKSSIITAKSKIQKNSNLPVCSSKTAISIDQPVEWNWDNCLGKIHILDGKFKDWKYDGNFKNGKLHGFGKIRYKDGSNFIGEFQKGKKHGKGTMVFGSKSNKAGDKYVGEYREGKKDGQGIFTFSDGEKYDGEWKNDKRNGIGKNVWANGSMYIGEWKSNKQNGFGTFSFANGDRDVGQWIDNKLNGDAVQYYSDGSIFRQGVFKDDKFLYDKKVLIENESINPNKALKNKENINCEDGFEKIGDNCISKALSDELVAALNKAKELEEELSKLKVENKKKKQKINSDDQLPTISSLKYNYSDYNVTIEGIVSDNVEVAEVLINNEIVFLDSDGAFQETLYIPRNGTKINIIAFDLKGNKSIKTIHLQRKETEKNIGPFFEALNPTGKIATVNKNSLALIVGISKYEKTSAEAIYADNDAKMFYDYARFKLGIPTSNIKELINENAEESEILLALKDWIGRNSQKGKSDIFIFFAGHGMSSHNGENMYLLPYDGSPRLLEDSAISRNRLFNEVSSFQPRSVSVFFDTCFSGSARDNDTLLSSRPVLIVPKEKPIPENFTLFSAAAADQVANPLKEVEHGMFSYFLMKGMEGNADQNNDNLITTGELHSYVQSNVMKHSLGSQTPELHGDHNKVLLRIN